MTELLEITVNGATRQIHEGMTVRALIEDLGFGERRVAVERNREVIPRASHDSAVLQGGDVVELVTFVGGG